MDRRYLNSYVPRVLTAMEGAGNNPNAPVFAGGQSGLSFGRMQNDVAANRDATHTFYNILNDTKAASGLSDFDVVMATLTGMTPGATEQQLNDAVPNGVAKVKLALEAGSAAVNARDAAQQAAVVNGVNRALDAAGEGRNVDPWLVTELADWHNRTGDLQKTSDYMRDNGITTRQAYDSGYLSQQPEFTKRSFPTWSGRVDAATRDALADLEPSLQPPPAANMFNSDSFRANMLNAAEDELHKAGY